MPKLMSFLSIGAGVAFSSFRGAFARSPGGAGGGGGGGTPLVSTVSALNPAGDGDNNMDLLGAQNHKSTLKVEAGTGGKFYFEVWLENLNATTHDILAGVGNSTYVGALFGDNANRGISFRCANPSGGGTGPDWHNCTRLEDGSYHGIGDFSNVPFGATFQFVVDTIARTFQAWCVVDGENSESWSAGGIDLGARDIDNVAAGQLIEVRLRDFQAAGKKITVNFGQVAFRHSPPIPVDYLGWGTP